MNETIQRVEKHIIKPSDSYFTLLMDFCRKSKNLYNHANFIIRDEFIKKDRWISYGELDKILKADTEYTDYMNMPCAQSAQQTLRVLEKNWKSFFKSVKDWAKHKEKYLGKPKMPRYLPKNGLYPLIMTNQNCKLRTDPSVGTDLIIFPKTFKGFTLAPQFIKRDDFRSFQQVRFIPHKNRIVAEIVYNIKKTVPKADNSRYIGIDIGINNLATVCNNVGLPAFVINGKPIKSVNQFYNKTVSHYREIAKRMNNRDYSKRMDNLTEKRNFRIDDYLHKASRYVVDYCVENDINTIVIGKNDEWKQNSGLSKRINQSFVGLPFAKLIEMIQYKAEERGIAVILTEESYTSGTSFTDNEEPVKENYNKARRIHRGLFKSNNGTIINADLNGAYQILKKVFPIKWDSGCALHPTVVNMA